MQQSYCMHGLPGNECKGMVPSLADDAAAVAVRSASGAAAPGPEAVAIAGAGNAETLCLLLSTGAMGLELARGGGSQQPTELYNTCGEI